MTENTFPEITLTRVRNGAEPRNDAGQNEAAASPAATQRRKPRSKAAPPAPKPSVDPDERMRQITAILLLLGGTLLMLALLSYTPLDQANTDISPRELTGLFTNDPNIAARADTTQNWLGLIGAYLSNALINGTIGYGTLVLPLLMGFWGLMVYRAQGYNRAARLTGTIVLLATIASGIFGTMQLIAWMPNPAHEWSGAIGAFLGTILSGLIGTAGAMLFLLVALSVTLIISFNLDVRKGVAMAKAYGNAARAKAAEARQSVSAKLGELSREESSAAEQTPAASQRASGTSHQPANADRIDGEPARMVRRMSVTPDPSESVEAPARGLRTSTIPFPEPRIARPAAPLSSASSAAAKGERNGSTQSDPIQHGPKNSAPEKANEAQTAATNRAASGSAIDSGVQLERTHVVKGAEEPSGYPAAIPPSMAEIEVAHIPTSAPAAPPSPLPASSRETAAQSPRLLVNVQELEIPDDQEADDDGELLGDLPDEQIDYQPPPVELLTPQLDQADVNDEELKENARILQEKLGTFNIQIENLTVTPGPVVTLYEFVPAAGIKIAQIESLADDIALALKARGIRIIAPIPGKGTVGVEIPNHKPAMVRIRAVLNTAKFREADFRLPLALGKTTIGEVFCDDLAKMPHLLIAGATGSGKSVGINAILASLLYKMHPADLKFAIIDPKKIELTQYRALKDHFLATSPDIDEDIVTNPQNAVILLKALEMEMDRRYDILAKGRQRNILDYNRKVEEGHYKNDTSFNHAKLPYIVVIVDELADLMITAAGEVEEPIARLAQLARAIGIHMIVATQRPSVNVITGTIKANFPARIAYQVATKIDSRTILDMNGAEQLLGNGDMLYLPGGMPKPVRLQNAFISTEEVEALCDHIGNQKGYSKPYLLPSVVEKKSKGGGGSDNERDELFEEAARLIVRHQQGSVSLIQRRLKVGYSRAARLVDELEMAGIVGPFDGSKARAVLLESESELEAYL
ncbi:MAG: DNA translocase FtsK [Chlorobi bacterium CHB2]|nr:DNA translocase FtsK [Chlorobi bacterium CHB2]